MVNDKRRCFGSVGVACVLVLTAMTAPARADEIWVAPTAQQDFGGLGIGSNTFWPATAAGVVRLAWSVPDNLQFFQNAKIALIPHASSAVASLTVFVCPAQHTDLVTANCAGPLTLPFTAVSNRLVEVDISGAIAPLVGTAGVNYLAVVAYSTSNIATDHIVGLRFGYAPKTPNGVATTAANSFSGTQTAPAFIGSGAGLTNLPFPAGAATLGANTFSGTQTAPAFAGSGASLTGVAKLAANVFSGTQTIDGGNLDLDDSTSTTGMITKNGLPFLHSIASEHNTFLGLHVGENSTPLGGGYNTAVGNAAMMFTTTGFSNTAFGNLALQHNTTGGRNTAIGINTLSNSIENANTALGASAGYTNVGGQDNIYLGADTGPAGFVSESNTIYLGKQGTHTKTIIAGIRGITTGHFSTAPVVVDIYGQLGTVSSSIRFKEDIHDMADASRRLLQLRPVTFRYTQAYTDGAKPIQYGLIAEEVADVFPELAVRGADGRVETVHYETLNVLLVNEVQKQQQRIEALEQKLNDLLGRLQQQD